MSKKRVGVIGTFIWDVIHGRTPRPVEEWGGITYALSAIDVALGNDWEVVLITKVGDDLAPRAREFTSKLKNLAPGTAPVEVPDPTNRVTLVYNSAERRSEYLTGGVKGWSWLGLKPLLADLDALYINLISGYELDLATTQLIRQNFKGPIYCDLHSLLLATGHDGLRTLQPLPNVAGWCACFDIMQVNEDEMHMMAPDGMALAATAIANGVSNLIVTVGARGAVYFAAPGFESISDLPDRRSSLPRGSSLQGAISTALVSVPQFSTSGIEKTSFVTSPHVTSETTTIDPTGCGDVWGATYFARLLAGDNFAGAMRTAHLAAARNAYFKGATGLADYLRGEIKVQ